MSGDGSRTPATRLRWGTRLALFLVVVEAVLVRLGRTHGSWPGERAQRMPGDELIDRPDVRTDHAVTIHAPASSIWPWLVQMGWGRAGWYTARWVDLLLFPANGPSAMRTEPDLQQVELGTFIPDGPPESGCGFTVVGFDPERSLVLRSRSHLPSSWRRHTAMDWTWAFVLTPLDEASTRLHVRSRWSTWPWWLTVGSRLGILPADFLMSRDMLRGVKWRAERARGPIAAQEPDHVD